MYLHIISGIHGNELHQFHLNIGAPHDVYPSFILYNSPYIFFIYMGRFTYFPLRYGFIKKFVTHSHCYNIM